MRHALLKNIILVLVIISFSSCDKYLDKEEDVPMTFEKIWTKREYIEQSLSTLWGFTVNPADWTNSHPFMGATDEASCTYDRAYRYINFGSWNPSNVPYNKMPQYYKGIREATVFMKYFPKNTAPDLQPEDNLWASEARFCRAYYYFQLVQLYGPVILLKDEILDFEKSTKELQRPRNSMDECVDWIVSELRKCEKELPETYSDKYLGKPTKGVCKALISELLLYYARPLFNGNVLYKDVKNSDGKSLFPNIETMNSDRWKNAASAAKEIIDMNLYQLYVAKDGGKINPLKSYEDIFLKNWNDELVWARIMSGWENRSLLIPRAAGGVAYGGTGPTQQQVDAYAMKNGKYPITGYEQDGTPIVDPTSGYIEKGFKEYVNPADVRKRKLKTFNMYIDREPRFYASVLWSNSRLPYKGSKKIVNFGFNGNSGPGASHDYPKSGYIIRKWIDPELNTQAGEWGSITYPIIRYAEILLNYVEALNEYDPGNSDIVKYLNMIRERAGVPNIEEVYPDAVGNKEKMRELIRHERRVELAFENKRFFDTRTWMIAEKVDGGPMWGMNVSSSAPSPNASTTPDNFWKRSVFETRVFEKKHYLYPFSQRELDRNKILTQNYGW